MPINSVGIMKTIDKRDLQKKNNKKAKEKQTKAGKSRRTEAIVKE